MARSHFARAAIAVVALAAMLALPGEPARADELTGTWTGNVELRGNYWWERSTRVIAPEHELYNASLVRREDESESLAYFWVRFDGEPTPFQPGQYMTIGVYVDGKIVQRPYSVASPPVEAGTSGYEFYVRLVEGGTFTPLLWEMRIGQRMRMIGPKGKFTLQPDDDRTHIFISSGTGNAPFVSMMKQLLADGAPRRGGLRLEFPAGRPDAEIVEALEDAKRGVFLELAAPR